MRETSFIQQNKDKWKQFEAELSSENKDPDKLSNILIQVTDDLSFARTFYPNRSVRVYLNNIAQEIFKNIYSNKKGNLKKLISFWKDELPLLTYRCRVQLNISLVIFVLSAAIGVVSTIYDSEFPRLILGDNYVEMTLDNIKKGDPLAVYKGANQADMFLGITYNNVMVAFRTFITGVFFAVGTLVIMVYNGIMLGTFQYFFYQKGLFLESFLTIWLHGTLEISSIIIAGASGLVLGRGLVFPGTFSRLQAFQISAKQGLKLFIGIVPILIFAAFIEGFITRYTEVPAFIKGSLILVSLFFILFYFVYYPYIKAKGQTALVVIEGKIHASKPHVIDPKIIKRNSEIFKDIFFFYQQNFSKIFWVCLSTSILYSLSAYFLFSDALTQNEGILGIQEKLFLFFDYQESSLPFILNSIFLAISLYAVGYYLIIFLKLETKMPALQFHQPLTLSIAFNLLFFLPTGLAILLSLILLPVIFLSSFAAMVENKDPFTGFLRGVELIGGSLGKVIVLYIMLSVLGIIFMLLIESPAIYILLNAIELFIFIDSENYTTYTTLIFLITTTLALQLIIPIMFIGLALGYFSIKEIKEATHLREMIGRLKFKNN